mmetsp:Transcript_42011/g.105623  ORF Transcript_42011/g.105623 Transcript_42011/m.105623 type:complete len:254 (+) Transcript_42011:1527-2288(+)
MGVFKECWGRSVGSPRAQSGAQALHRAAGRFVCLACFGPRLCSSRDLRAHRRCCHHGSGARAPQALEAAIHVFPLLALCRAGRPPTSKRRQCHNVRVFRRRLAAWPRAYDGGRCRHNDLCDFRTRCLGSARRREQDSPTVPQAPGQAGQRLGLHGPRRESADRRSWHLRWSAGCWQPVVQPLHVLGHRCARRERRALVRPGRRHPLPPLHAAARRRHRFRLLGRHHSEALGGIRLPPSVDLFGGRVFGGASAR